MTTLVGIRERHRDRGWPRRRTATPGPPPEIGSRRFRSRRRSSSLRLEPGVVNLKNSSVAVSSRDRILTDPLLLVRVAAKPLQCMRRQSRRRVEAAADEQDQRAEEIVVIERRRVALLGGYKARDQSRARARLGSFHLRGEAYSHKDHLLDDAVVLRALRRRVDDGVSGLGVVLPVASAGIRASPW